jgi:DNA-binding NarL/FixJ family response regulator
VDDELRSAAETGVARLVVADDHALVRSGVRSMLAGEPDLEIVGEAENGREAVELCRRLRPDLVLMDVRMPEMDGLAATRAIKEELPRISVVMVTMEEEPDYLLEAVRAGAAGYVLKGATPEQLTAAVRKVLDGELLLDQGLTMSLLTRLADQKEQEEPSPSPGPPPRAERHPEPLLEPLTPREREILGLLTRGHTNREIARQLVVSPGTVKNHVRHIIAKLGVSDRTQAAVRAVELGLLAPQ